MVAGASIASANTESGGDAGATTSQSAKPADNKPDSDQGDSVKLPRHRHHVSDVKSDDDADYTASYLAEETNSIVVAPTITSKIFATDGMWLGGDQMHQAAADLFNDDNTALLESAQEAGYTQDELPQNVVLAGHSFGGGFVIDTARYMVENQENGDSCYYHLAGVLMLDGVSFTDPVPILAGIPPDIPVYNLSGTP